MKIFKQRICSRILYLFVIILFLPFLNSGCKHGHSITQQRVSTEDLFVEADSLYTNQAYALAAEKYNTILLQKPDTALIWDRLARSMYFLDQYPEAIEAFKKAAELKYRTTSNMYNVAISYGKIGDIEQGLDWIEKAINAGFSNKYGLLINNELDIFRDEPRWRTIISTFFESIDFPELSQPNYKIRNTGITNVEMRDGIELATEVVLPEGPGPFPVILVRTPYGKGWEIFHRSHWAARGYALVVQDTRGRGDSDGEWEPWLNERKDGYDTIDWISQQSWANGNVGMIGASYVAQVQWLAAVEAHPALKAIVPLVAGTDPFFDTPYDHGIMKMGLINWAYNTTYPGEEIPEYETEELSKLPLSEVDNKIFKKNVPIWDEWIHMDTPEDWQRASFVADLDKVQIPVLHVSGLWDVESIGTAKNWMSLKQLGFENQWLVFGPWAHQNFIDPIITSRGDIEYGEVANINMQELWIRWFDHWLKGKDVNWISQPRAQVFLTGKNEWINLENWPSESSNQVNVFLNEDDDVDSAFGKLKDKNITEMGKRSYIYDPDDITLRSNNTFEQSTVFEIDSAANDELRYSTGSLEEPLAIVGPVELDLFFSTDVPDTDFFVFLLDIDEQGIARAIGQPGKMRAKFLHGWENPASLEADSIYKMNIPMFPVAHQFDKGHKIGIAIRSEWFPRFVRNSNTITPQSEAVKMNIAVQNIFHGNRYPSALKLWTLPLRQD